MPDGTIREKRGMWCATLDFGYHPRTGKRWRPERLRKTYKEAEAALKQLRKERDELRRTGIADDNITLSRFIDLYLDHARTRVRDNTYATYEQLLRLHVKPSLGNRTLKELCAHPDLIQRHINRRASTGSAGSVRTMRSVLSTVFRYAIKWRYCATNPVALTDAPPPVGKREVPWSLDDIRALLRASKGTDLETFCTVALSLGLRRGEALALRWQDVDFDAGTLSVRYTLYRKTGVGLVLGPPKSASSRRTIHLPATTLSALRAHRDRDGITRLPSAFIFERPCGNPYEPFILNIKFNALVKSAGLKPIHVHDMRHLAASMMIAQNIPLEVVSHVLGHSSLSITAGLYLHLYTDTLKGAADKVDTFFATGG